MLVTERRPHHCSKWTIVLSLTATALAGCNRMQTEEEAVNQYYKNNQGPQPARVPVAKLAGRVSVDGLPPAQNAHLFVVLYDPQHLEKPVDAPRVMTQCDAEGNFAFTTYVAGDGVPYGKYVVGFVELRRPVPARGRGLGARAGRQQEFVGPDELKNLYNDPDKNKDNPSFVLNVEAPGHSDYDFNLTLAGKEPVAKAGEYAVTRIKSRS